MVALVQVDGKHGKKVRGGYWEWVAKFIPRWVYEVMSLAYNLLWLLESSPGDCINETRHNL